MSSPAAAPQAAPLTEGRIRSILREELGAAHEAPPLLDIGGVARRLSISVRSAEKLVAAHEIVPIQVGGVRRFDPDAVEAYIRRNVRGGRAGR